MNLKEMLIYAGIEIIMLVAMFHSSSVMTLIRLIVFIMVFIQIPGAILVWIVRNTVDMTTLLLGLGVGVCYVGLWMYLLGLLGIHYFASATVGVILVYAYAIWKVRK